jgi:hypothetical protein
MHRMKSFLMWITLLASLIPSAVFSQTRTTGQIVGTVKDATGAVIRDAAVVLIDTGTGNTVETKSGSEGGFVFPNLQPGTYTITATAQGFQPVTLQQIEVLTSRSTDVTVQFQIAGVTEQVQVEGRSPVIETTSTTVANTVRNEEIAKLPLSGRNILGFALLVPGAAQSTGSRDSEYNGLSGGAINITLDGVNNNSQRFRSGGTSFFVFAPIRLGAIEEVTVSTAGLTSEAGAEGAVQVQFTTKRGTNRFRGQVFDTIQHEGLNARGFVDKARGEPKTKLRQHEYGANFGGPILHNKLFFFVNFEQAYSPSETNLGRTILTPEAQQGILRYVDSAGATRTFNLLDLARANGLPSTIDPYIAGLFQQANATVGQGNLVPQTALHQNELRFTIKDEPDINVYPSARVDYQASPSLAVRGILNLHYRNLPRTPPYPGLSSILNGFRSTYYIGSGGVDWTARSNLFNSVSAGIQSNYEEFGPQNPGNPSDLFTGPFGLLVNLPLGMTSPVPTGNLFNPRNNPVYNISDTLTWLKGRHTFTMGGSFRRTSDYDKGFIPPPAVTLGIANNDPAANVISLANIPGLRNADLGTARSLYALLVGRISNASGSMNLNPDTGQYEQVKVPRNEAQNVGGLYAQDQWRVNPTLTLNYGLRWELTGAVYNPSGVYSAPTVADLFGPSTAVFQPGVLNGVADPQIQLRPKPYKGDFNNPAPNVGIAWNPDKPDGFLGRLLGKAVYRGNFGISYYDEGLIAFESAAGNGPGATQTLALPPFTPGSLNLQTPLPAFTRNPETFAFPVPMSDLTFTRGFATIKPDLKSPTIYNWTLGYQRELWRNAALEIRYVANRGRNIWRSYDLNETNIIENGFVDEFRNAQRNLEINQAAGVNSFQNRSLPGQVPLPILETAFGTRGSQPALSAGASYTNATFLEQLRQGEAGALANTLAGSGGQNFQYMCRLVGSSLPACASRGYDAAGPYPINFFQANPFAAGNVVRLLTDEASTQYDALQLQFRQRYHSGLNLTMNYTFGKARTDRYDVTTNTVQDYRTMRNKDLDWGPTAYDLRHIFQAYGTYELPFGRDRRFNINSPVLNQIFGGWSTSTIVRIQTGRPFLLESGRNTLNQEDAGVILNGITVDELQKMVTVSPSDDGRVFYLDQRLIGPDGRANPDFITYPTEPGQQGQYVYLYGPGMWTVDIGLSKTFRLGGDRVFNFEALFINAFNHRNPVAGGTNGASVSIDSTTFGQSTGNSTGSRDIQFRLGFNF